MPLFFTLHYALFSTTHIINLHLLLEELYQIIWINRPQKGDHMPVTSRPTTQFEENIQDTLEPRSHLLRSDVTTAEGKFFFIHSSLFIVAMSSFVARSIQADQLVETYNEEAKLKQLKSMKKSLTSMLIFQILLLYSTITKVDGQTSYLLRLLHTLAALLWICLHTYSVCETSPIVNSLAIDHCISTSQSSVVYYKFISYLIVGSFSVGSLAVSSSEIFNFLVRLGQEWSSYSSSVIPLLIITTGIELMYIQLFSPGSKLKTNSDIASSNTVLTGYLTDRAGKDLTSCATSVHEKALYSMGSGSRGLPRNYLSLVSCQPGDYPDEVVKSSDEDEWDNSVDIFCLWQSMNSQCHSMSSPKYLAETNRAPKKFNEVDLFDKSKFSLYEDYGSVDKSLRDYRVPEVYDSCVTESLRLNPIHLKLSYILFTVIKTFPTQLITLAIIGAVYKANQLCFVAGYFKYVACSPMGEDLSMLMLSFDYTTSEQTSAILWMQLITASTIIVQLSKIIAMVYLNPAMFKHGLEKTLNIALIHSIAIVPMYLASHFVFTTTQLDGHESLRTTLVLGNITLIQVLIGCLRGVVESYINESSLYLSQQVLNYHASKSASKDVGKTNPSIQCVVNGLLNDSFNLLGTALLSSLALIANMVLSHPKVWHCPAMTMTVSIIPIAILVIVMPLSIALYVRKLKILEKG